MTSYRSWLILSALSVLYHSLNVYIRGDRIRWGWFTCALIVFSLLLLCKSPITKILDYFSQFLNKKFEHYKAARVIWASTVCMTVIFLFKIHAGFFFSGIFGWTYRYPKTVKNCSLEELVDAPKYLKSALNQSAAKYLDECQIISGAGLFMHFEGGEVLPYNDELTGFVFPRYIKGDHEYFNTVRFGLRWEHFKDDLKYNWLSYPNHSVYMPIDYSGYPDYSKIQQLSRWRISIIKKDGSIRIYNYKIKKRINS